MLTSFFFFNDTATTEIYTLSLHDALPILAATPGRAQREPSGDAALQKNVGFARSLVRAANRRDGDHARRKRIRVISRSEEHTSELQSQSNLVCRLLLEKKHEQHL